MMQSFYNKTFSGNRVAVVGLGMDHARLSSYAGQLTLEAGEGPKGEAKYYGGKQRCYIIAQCSAWIEFLLLRTLTHKI